MARRGISLLQMDCGIVASLYAELKLRSPVAIIIIETSNQILKEIMR